MTLRPRHLLPILAALALAACGGGGGGTSTGGSGGGGAGANPIPLSFDGYADFRAYVDSAGVETNVSHARVAVFGGDPGAAGYTFTLERGAGVPSTVTLDPATGVIGGTPGNGFVPGSPGVLVPPATYAYDLTVKVSDGTTTITSPAGAFRLFVTPCNSSAAPWSCGSSTPPYPQGPPDTTNFGAWTSATPLDVAYEMSVTQVKVGKSFGFLPPLVGGDPPYAFALTSGAIPPGLVLDAATGLVRGIPATADAGQTYTFAVTATDGHANTSTAYYTVDRLAN